MEDFVVRHYISDEAPMFKGNGFDGIRVGEDREEAQRLADYINALRKDAERYRWLRDDAHDWDDAKIINLYAGPDFERATGEELDAIIDIEMAPKRYVLGAA